MTNALLDLMLPEESLLAVTRSRMALAILLGGFASGISAWLVAVLLRNDNQIHGVTWRRYSRRFRLNADDRRLLSRVARFARLSTPTSLLVAEGCYDHAVKRYVRRFGGDTRLNSIRRLVFE